MLRGGDKKLRKVRQKDTERDPWTKTGRVGEGRCEPIGERCGRDTRTAIWVGRSTRSTPRGPDKERWGGERGRYSEHRETREECGEMGN